LSPGILSHNTLHQAARTLSAERGISSIKFIDPIDIIPGLVADALEKSNPVRELITLQGKKWFGYPKAQQHLIDCLWRVERDAFDCLVSSGDVTDQLHGCMAHRGELFIKFTGARNVSGSAQSVLGHGHTTLSRDCMQHQRIAWAGLMTEELQYLGKHPKWSNDLRALAYHAASGMNRLLSPVSSGDNAAIPAHVVGPLVHALSNILQGAALTGLIRHDCSEEDALVLQEVISLASSLDDLVISEEVVGLVPAILEVCRARFPDEFCKDAWSDIEDNQDCLDDLCEDEEQDEGTAEVLEDDRDELEQGAGYEVLDEEDVEDDPGAQYSELRSVEDEAVFNVLIPALGLGLRELRRLPAAKNHAEYLKDILATTPMGMVLWQELVDTLISIAPDSFQEFLPALLPMCLKDDNGALCILGIADYAFRKDIDVEEGPLPFLVDALRAFDLKDKQMLLQAAEEYLECGPELFLDPGSTREALNLLRNRLEG
jgi:hypothetical protein